MEGVIEASAPGWEGVQKRVRHGHRCQGNHVGSDPAAGKRTRTVGISGAITTVQLG